MTYSPSRVRVVGVYTHLSPLYRPREHIYIVDDAKSFIFPKPQRASQRLVELGVRRRLAFVATRCARETTAM